MSNDGQHEISCKPFPTDGLEWDNDSDPKMVQLIALPMQGTRQAAERMPETKTVEVNGVQKVFERRGLEYYINYLSLTTYLFGFRHLKGNVIKIY